MPKRRHESKDERWARKIKEYQEKLQGKRSRNNQRVIYSSDEDNGVQPEDHLESDQLLPLESLESQPDETQQNSATEIEVPEPNEQEVEVAAEPSPAETFDPELLEVLGEAEVEIVEFGEDIEESLAKRFQKILSNGLTKEAREELHKKHLFPKNVPLAKAPTLNPEIGFLPETCKARDKRLITKQDQLGRGLSALGKAMTELLRKRKPDISEVLKILNEAGKLIADSHFAETETRRTVILPLVDKSLAETFKDRKRDGFLFGEKLDDLVRSSRGINRTSQMIQGSTPSTSSLNWRGPYPRTRQQRGGHPYSHRGGGQQRAAQYRRRPDPPPPPPPRQPYRRPPPPPPPPQSARRQPPAPPSQRAPVDRHRRD